MMQKLALFPLNTVLFPGTNINLHIFEERYRLMIARCLEESSQFGITLIRNSTEVDPNDLYIRQLEDEPDSATEKQHETVPFSIGTTARITECHQFDDGRYYLTAVGIRRFRIQYLLHQQPYLQGSVSLLQEQTHTDLPLIANALRELYTQYWQAIALVSSQPPAIEPLPEDPIELSYLLASRLRVDLQRKQRWLEADALIRLRELGAALYNEIILIPGARPNRNNAWMWR